MLKVQFCPYNQITYQTRLNHSLSFKGEDKSSAENKVGYIVAGGTINTEEKDGVKVCSNDVLIKLLSDFSQKIRSQISPFKNPIDSSNYTRDLQYRLMGAVSNDVFKQIDTKDYDGGDQIAKKHFWSFKKPLKASGEVVTHGTDTLEENSALLAYERLPASVIYTASWASPFSEGSDAIQNISKAQKLASDNGTPPGVFVVIGNEIHLATRVHKIDTKPVMSIKDFPNPRSYFESIGDEPVGRFDDNGNIIFNPEFLKTWQKIIENNPIKKYDIDMSKGIKPAYVEHLVVNENTDVRIFQDLAKRLSIATPKDRRGAVIEGNFPKTSEVQAIINNLSQNSNILILNAADYKGLFPMQTRIKLAALLGMTKIPTKDIPELMKTNIAGEVLDKQGIEKSKWNIPKAFSDRAEFIIAFPGMEKNLIEDAVDRLDKKHTDNQKVLLINGYGDGNLPIGTQTMEERLIEGFTKIGQLELAEVIIESIKKEAKDKEANFSMPNVIKHTTKMMILYRVDNPQAEAKELLKRAFVETNDILKALDTAQQKGIKIKIGVKPDFATPDLSAYEIGTILKLIGAEGTDMPTRKYIESFAN